jgi:hypothetical protein
MIVQTQIFIVIPEPITSDCAVYFFSLSQNVNSPRRLSSKGVIQWVQSNENVFSIPARLLGRIKGFPNANHSKKEKGGSEKIFGKRD